MFRISTWLWHGNVLVLILLWYSHRHLSNKDCLMAHPTCLVCFISTVNGRFKKRKKRSLGSPALVAGT